MFRMRLLLSTHDFVKVRHFHTTPLVQIGDHASDMTVLSYQAGPMLHRRNWKRLTWKEMGPEDTFSQLSELTERRVCGFLDLPCRRGFPKLETAND